MTRLILMTVALLLAASSITSAQGRRPFSDDEAYQRLLETTRERDLESLLEAVDTFDLGNFEVIRPRGFQGSGGRLESKFAQIIKDERVLKIYQLLKELPKDEAAKLVSKSYNRSLSRIKRSGLGSVEEIYGLHVKLWLSLEFESREKFNRNFANWHDWYVDHAAGKISKSILKTGRFDSSYQRQGPEPLMYINLVLIDLVRNDRLDRNPEFSKLLKKLDLEYGTAKLYPFDGEPEEPLVKVPFILGWSNLGALEYKEEARVIRKVSTFIDESRRLHEAVNDWLPTDEMLKEVLRFSRKKATSMGTQVKFVGAKDTGYRFAQAWRFSASRQPLKREVLLRVNHMLKRTAPSERAEWEEIVAEFETWLDKVPSEGIEVKKKRVWEWPESDEGNGKKLQLTISRTTSLRDEESQEYLDEKRRIFLLIRDDIFRQHGTEVPKAANDR